MVWLEVWLGQLLGDPVYLGTTAPVQGSGAAGDAGVTRACALAA